MEPDTGILFQEIPHQRGFVSGKIVQDDVDLLVGRTQGDNFLQERDKVLTGVASGSLAVNAASRRVQRRIQRKRSMTVVLESVPLDAARRKWKNRIETVQRLNGGLLSHTKNGCVLRWVQIQTDDVGRFGFEFRLVAGHVPLQAVGLQTGFLPDAMHGVFADAQFRSQLAATPVGRTVLRLPTRGGKNPRTQLRSQYKSRLSGMAGIQTIDSRSTKTLLPPDDGWCRRPQLLLDGAERRPLGQHQDQSRAEYISGRQRAGLGNAAEFELLAVAEHYGIAGHTYLDVNLTSNVYSATGH